MRRRFNRFPIGLAAGVTAGVMLIPLLLMVGGYDAGAALGAALRGAFGSIDAILSATLVRATPLIVAGLAVAIAFRAGVLNIGAEGQLLAGAVMATVVLSPSGTSGPFDLGAAIVAAAAGGALVALIPAVLRRYFGVLEVVSTIMMNFVVLHVVGFLVRGPLQEPTGVFPQSPSIPAEARMPGLVAGSRLHLGFVLAILLATAAWWFLRSTAPGFRIRAGGAGADAAAAAGMVDVPKVTFRAFLLSGALAGVAGGIELTGVTFALYENLSPGYGYTAIAVALMAGLNPLGVIGAAVFFGALAAGGAAMQREAGVPSVIASVVEAVVILAAVAAAAVGSRSGGSRGPGDTSHAKA
ncbi:MAG: ABC transporter permease [Gemmatimonadota bacterium]